MKKSKSSKRWLQEHFSDPYVKRAQQQGYRSRAVFKLLEIQDKDHIIKPGMRVVDLGAAPGGWSQVAAKIVGEKGQVIALDLLPIEPIAGVDIVQGDFSEPEILDKLMFLIGEHSVDLVISDIAPNMSGNKAVDQPRAIYLAELALDFAKQVLSPGGTLLMKVFQGEGFDALLKEARQSFEKVIMRKPKASRPRSREAYLLAKGYTSV